jgi:hypothetical protein
MHTAQFLPCGRGVSKSAIMVKAEGLCCLTHWHIQSRAAVETQVGKAGLAIVDVVRRRFS